MSFKTYSTHAPNRRQTPQTEPIPGETQVQNNAGGFVYGADLWTQFDRFLILGTTGGTYYVSEQKLTRDNANMVAVAIGENGLKAVARIVEISQAGRAPSNDPALFALAMAASAASADTRRRAFEALPKVARIPTHLFHFVEYLKGLRGWGRGVRRALQDWVNQFEADKLAFEFAKYQSRDGWSTRDVLRKAHVKARTPAHDTVLRWAVAGAEGLGERTVLPPTSREKRPAPGVPRRYGAVSALPPVITAMEAIKHTTDEAAVTTAITDYGLTREMVPTQFLKSTGVWEALLAKMPMEAMIRNLGNMTKVGLLTAGAAATKTVVERLADSERLRKARIHPLKVVNALMFYKQGGAAGRAAQRGAEGYTPVRAIVDALDDAFYASFGTVEPTGKNLILALDVSGSMGYPLQNTALTFRDATAVLAMVTARVEPNYVVLGFSASASPRQRYSYGGHNAVCELTVSPRQRLDDVVKAISDLPFGGTDCALPALWAAEQRTPYDGIVVYTDNETWAGGVHPSQALRDYRAKAGTRTKQVVVSMAATEFSIADPKDPLQLDVVGFDLNTPDALAQFIRA